MRLAAAGDDAAFGRLVQKYQQAMMNFFLRLGVRTDMEDLAQETFLRIHRYRERYQPTAKFTTFLYMVARTAWLDRARKRGRYAAFQEAYGLHVAAEEQAAGRPEPDRPDLRAAMERLPEKLREILVLSVYEELKYQEIATILGIPEGTVKSRVHAAVAALREQLRKEPPS